MVKREEINGVIFIEQRTYYIYKSQEDLNRGIYSVATSSEESFDRHKEYQRSADKKGEKGLPLIF